MRPVRYFYPIQLSNCRVYAADICGVADRMGSLEPGKDADIAIFDGNPMEVFTQTLYTIIDGEIAYEAGK